LGRVSCLEAPVTRARSSFNASVHDRSLKAGVITFEQDSLVACRIWDFSSAGVGLFVTTAVELPAEFDLIFDCATRHCVTVWREFNRIGLRYKSMR
jgi:hypothetical protein